MSAAADRHGGAERERELWRVSSAATHEIVPQAQRIIRATAVVCLDGLAKWRTCPAAHQRGLLDAQVLAGDWEHDPQSSARIGRQRRLGLHTFR